MTSKIALQARTVLRLEVPERMQGPVAQVLEGEYETGYSGAGLTIVDLGANVGAFSLWANLRWPHSTVHAYEPHPGTFEILTRNVDGLPNVVCHRAAVWPGPSANQAFFARYPGDGEGGLVSCVSGIFERVEAENTITVPTIAPERLPACDVLKVDVEGAEADILEHMELRGTSLVLVEYHKDEGRQRIERLFAGDFVCEHVDAWPWSGALRMGGYRADLAGNHFGHLFFVNRHANKLQKVEVSDPLAPGRRPSLRGMLSTTLGAARQAVSGRLRRAFR